MPGGRRLDWWAAVLPHPRGPARAPPDHAGQAGSTMLPRPSSNSLTNRALVAKLPRASCCAHASCGWIPRWWRPTSTTGGMPIAGAAARPPAGRGRQHDGQLDLDNHGATETISQHSGGYLATFRSRAIFVQLTMTGRWIFEGSAIMRFLLKDGPVEAQSHLIGVLTARDFTLRFDQARRLGWQGSNRSGSLDSSEGGFTIQIPTGKSRLQDALLCSPPPTTTTRPSRRRGQAVNRGYCRGSSRRAPRCR